MTRHEAMLRTPILVKRLPEQPPTVNDFEQPAPAWVDVFADRAEIKRIRPTERVQLDEIQPGATTSIRCRWSKRWQALQTAGDLITIHTQYSVYAVKSIVNEDEANQYAVIACDRTNDVAEVWQ